MASDSSWLNRPPRLGDLIDDYCPRCKRLMNHAIASFVGDKVVKVICQTCHSEHPYLEGKDPKKASKAAAFKKVSSKVAASSKTTAEEGGKKPKAKSATRPLIRHKAKTPGKKK
jgi:hypothetical protein